MAAQQGHAHVNYFLIFMALCLLTGLSIVTDVVDFSNKRLLIVVVLSVAMAKALYVMLYFMHLKFEGKWKYVLLAPTIILACGVPMALMPDIGMHYYLEDVPQLRATEGHGADHIQDNKPGGSAQHSESQAEQ